MVIPFFIFLLYYDCLSAFGGGSKFQLKGRGKNQKKCLNVLIRNKGTQWRSQELYVAGARLGHKIISKRSLEIWSALQTRVQNTDLFV